MKVIIDEKLNFPWFMQYYANELLVLEDDHLVGKTMSYLADVVKDFGNSTVVDREISRNSKSLTHFFPGNSLKALCHWFPNEADARTFLMVDLTVQMARALNRWLAPSEDKKLSEISSAFNELKKMLFARSFILW